MPSSPAPVTQVHRQASAYASPWLLSRRLALVAWKTTWAATCAWTPKPLNPWRLLVLKLFGATLHGTPFVHQRARIDHPWNLTMHHRACLGDRAHAYSLGPIVLHEGVTIAQEAYLCTGTHDFRDPKLSLVTSPIVIEPYAFVGARAFILPGVTVGRGAVVGACAVVTKDVAPGTIVAGNPVRVIGKIGLG